jgi:hypothetical protein
MPHTTTSHPHAMTNPIPTPAQQPRAKPTPSSSSEDAFHVPPVASKEAPEGPDVTDQPGAEAGHYGMGYGDPTRHQGGEPPGADPAGTKGDARRGPPGAGQQ